MLKKLSLYCFLFCFIQNIQAQYATLIVKYEKIALGKQDSTLFLQAVPARFGSPVPFSIKNKLSAPLIFPKDRSNTLSACDSIPSDLTGKIAVINKTKCSKSTSNSLVSKCYRAWQKGASAVLIVNSSDALKTMTVNPNDASEIALAKLIDIPCLMISNKNGMILRANAPKLPIFLLQPNNKYQDASPIESGTTIVTDEIEYGGIGLDSSSANSTWFKFTAPEKGSISLHSCDRGVNTHLGIFTIPNSSLQLET
ncbi:MAG: hypothetical protein RLZZ292_4076, partial [Bacteroidota bacterium]